MAKRKLCRQILCFLVVYLLGTLALPISAQIIKGQVKDSKTAEVLPFVNVFINETSIGAATDINGFFSISANSVSGTSQELVVSFIGYWPYKVKVNIGSNILDLGIINLIPSEIELNSVEVAAKKDKDWERKLRKFKKIFLGDDKLIKPSSRTKSINVLYFKAS